MFLKIIVISGFITPTVSGNRFPLAVLLAQPPMEIISPDGPQLLASKNNDLYWLLALTVLKMLVKIGSQPLL